MHELEKISANSPVANEMLLYAAKQLETTAREGIPDRSASIICLASTSYTGIHLPMKTSVIHHSLDQARNTHRSRTCLGYDLLRLLFGSMKNIMFVYAFDRELIDNENAGLKS